MGLWNNFTGHLSTILHHKKLVRGLCFRAGLYKQGIMHDWSKYNPVEFFVGVKYYQGGKRSPNFGEKEDMDIHLHGCTTKAATNIILNTG